MPEKQVLAEMAQFFDVGMTNDADDTITHTLSTTLIGPDGKVAQFYPGNEWTADQVMADVKKAASRAIEAASSLYSEQECEMSGARAMSQDLKIRKDGELDFLSLGALVHRLDPGIIPFRKATECKIHVSGGEFNVAANLV